MVASPSPSTQASTASHCSRIQGAKAVPFSPPTHDRHVREALAGRFGDATHLWPLVQEHVGDADQADPRVDALDDLLGGQPDALQDADGRLEVRDLLHGLAGSVDELHRVAGLAQRRGDVGQPDRWCRPVGRQAAGQHHHGGAQQRDRPGLGRRPTPADRFPHGRHALVGSCRGHRRGYRRAWAAAWVSLRNPRRLVRTRASTAERSLPVTCARRYFHARPGCSRSPAP